MLKNIGMIYGDVVNNKFTFSTQNYYMGNFVVVLYELDDEELLYQIGEVIERKVYNDFLSNPEIIKFINEDMDLKKDIIYTYKVDVIGTINKQGIVKQDTCILPGAKVYEATSEMVKNIYGISSEGIYVGRLKKMIDCNVLIDTNKIFNPHMIVVGKTGSGKSFFIKKILSNIQETFWVFSPSGEYNIVNYQQEFDVLDDFILPLETDFISFYASLNITEESFFQNVKFDLEKVYTIKEIVSSIYGQFKLRKYGKRNAQLSLFEDEDEDEVQVPTYINTLINKLRSLGKLKFTKSVKKQIMPKDSYVFDLNKYGQREQECIINFYLFKLLQNIKRKRNVGRHIIVIEEAHNYVSSRKNTICKEIIVRLSREGRKYGISLCFVTQRPRYFDQTALSQSGNKVIFSLPHPDDVKHVIEEVSYYNSQLNYEIQRQRVGDCVIIGDAYNGIIQAEIL